MTGVQQDASNRSYTPAPAVYPQHPSPAVSRPQSTLRGQHGHLGMSAYRGQPSRAAGQTLPAAPVSVEQCVPVLGASLVAATQSLSHCASAGPPPTSITRSTSSGRSQFKTSSPHPGPMVDVNKLCSSRTSASLTPRRHHTSMQPGPQAPALSWSAWPSGPLGSGNMMPSGLSLGSRSYPNISCPPQQSAPAPPSVPAGMPSGASTVAQKPHSEASSAVAPAAPPATAPEVSSAMPSPEPDLDVGDGESAQTSQPSAVDGWNDDTVVARNTGVLLLPENICLDDPGAPSSRQKSPGEFTWTGGDLRCEGRQVAAAEPPREPQVVVWGHGLGVDKFESGMEHTKSAHSKDVALSDHDSHQDVVHQQQPLVNETPCRRQFQADERPDVSGMSLEDRHKRIRKEYLKSAARDSSRDDYDACGDVSTASNRELSRNARRTANSGLSARTSYSEDGESGESITLDSESLLSRPLAFATARVLLESVNQRTFVPTLSAYGNGGLPIYDGSVSFKEHFRSARLTVDPDTECRSTIEVVFFDSLPRQNVWIHSIDRVANHLQLQRFVQRIEEESPPIVAGFHGLHAEDVEDVWREGRIEKGCGASIGIHAGTAHAHAEPDQKGRRFMCVALVIVGRSASSDVRALASDRMVNPTQYVFVEDDRLLATHLITYSVRGSGPRRVGGGFDDPFVRKLSSAVQRSGSRQRANGREPRRCR